MAEKKYDTLPSIGDIVWAKFPELQYATHQPGPKPRPALVVSVSQQKHTVKVVYGTSQKINRIYPTEFAILKSDSGFAISGLDRSTKFDMGAKVNLPYDDTWFDIAPSRQGEPCTTPIMGTLHPSYIVQLRLANDNVKP